MVHIYLLGERKHHTIESVIGVLSRLDNIQKRKRLGCLSFELDHEEYQPLLDKIAKEEGPAGSVIPVANPIIEYALRQDIPMIASEDIHFPEYLEMVAVEKHIEAVRADFQNGLIPEEDMPQTNESVGNMLQRYKELTLQTQQIRDENTSYIISNYIRDKDIGSLAHICGSKHIPNLESHLLRKGYLVVSMVI